MTRRRLSAAAAICWLSLAWVDSSQAEEAFQIESASTRLQDGMYLMDAKVRLSLSDDAAEALENGVPLTFASRVEVRRTETWFWEGDLVELRQRSVLRYHPLSGQYQVTDLQSSVTRNFATRAAALSALGEFKDVLLVSSQQLEKGETYKVEFWVYLDVEALPLPLRPLAHLSSQWSLESEPRSWPLHP